MNGKHYILWGLLLLCTCASGADSRRIVPFILKWEGGWALMPNDPGGEANKGVTLATWQHFYGKNAYAEFRAMPAEKWGRIFKAGYWDVVYGDSITHQGIADVLAEWCWISGSMAPVRAIQRLLGMKVDGVMGMSTVRQINRYANKEALLEQLFQVRFAFINNICRRNAKFAPFQDGWTNRLAALEWYEARNYQP